MLHLLLSFASCFAAKSVATGEWDVYSGTSVGYDPHVLYSFEFHQGKTGIVATLWRSDDPTNQPIFKFADGRIAQINIQFGNGNSGVFNVNGETVNFEFDEEAGLPSSSFTVAGTHYEIRIIKEDVMEITVGEIEFVAMLQEPVQVIAPVEIPKSGVVEDIEQKFSQFLITFLNNLSIFCGRFGEHEQHAFYGILILILNIILYIFWKLLTCMCCRSSSKKETEDEAEDEEEPKHEEEETKQEEEEAVEEVAKEENEEDEVVHRKNC